MEVARGESLLGGVLSPSGDVGGSPKLEKLRLLYQESLHRYPTSSWFLLCRTLCCEHLDQRIIKTEGRSNVKIKGIALFRLTGAQTFIPISLDNAHRS